MENGLNPEIQAVRHDEAGRPHCAFAATCRAPLPPPT